MRPGPVMTRERSTPDGDTSTSGLTRRGSRASLRRLRCPTHGVITEAVPFARPVGESRFTRDFEHLVAWACAKMDKTTVTKLLRVAWRTPRNDL
ncbi:transposase family protein [Ferrimicrobium sp.]|uniref:transposase family protein n=1 Tax=Ferrimicrobium sp. TaxID=2926050 RepID=UPI0035A6B53B